VVYGHKLGTLAAPGWFPPLATGLSCEPQPLAILVVLAAEACRKEEDGTGADSVRPSSTVDGDADMVLRAGAPTASIKDSVGSFINRRL
jgi:hypothetical protein